MPERKTERRGRNSWVVRSQHTMPNVKVRILLFSLKQFATLKTLSRESKQGLSQTLTVL